MTSLYVFALTSETARPVRYAGHRVEFVDLGGVHAAVERARLRPAVSEESLRVQHEIVMRIARQVDAILPARFGALVERGELETLVQLRRAPIETTLALVSGRVQMTVRVVASGAPRSGNEAADTPFATATPRSGTDYLQQRRTEAVPLTGPGAAISAAVRHLVRQERRAPGKGRIEWTLYHLVDRTAVDDYQQAIAQLGLPGTSCTGPWPPFAFVPDLWS